MYKKMYKSADVFRFLRNLAAHTRELRVSALAFNKQTLGRIEAQLVLTLCALVGYTRSTTWCSKVALLGSALRLWNGEVGGPKSYASQLTATVAVFSATSLLRGRSHASSAHCLLAAVFFLKHRESAKTQVPIYLVRGSLCVLNALALAYVEQREEDDAMPAFAAILREMQQNHSEVMKRLPLPL